MDHMNVVSPTSLRKKIRQSDFKIIWSGSQTLRSEDSNDNKTARSNVMDTYMEGLAKTSDIKVKAPPSTNATDTTKTAKANYRVLPTNSSRASKHKQVADRLNNKYEKKTQSATQLNRNITPKYIPKTKNLPKLAFGRRNTSQTAGTTTKKVN